jgi:hypothetical protein
VAKASSCVTGHTVHVYDRGGKRRLHTLKDLQQVQYGRVMDGKSTAEITITGQACDEQSDVLNAISPRRHEIVIFRGDDRVWEGPIVNTASTSARFVIKANDVLEYIDFTALSKAWPTRDDYKMVDRIREMFEYELKTPYTVTTGAGTVTVPRWETVDPPANVSPYLLIAQNGTTITTSETLAFEMTLGEHLGNLGRSVGVNFTTVGRSIVVWDGSLSKTRTMTEADVNGDFEVIRDGGGFFNVSHVIAQSQEEDEPPVLGHATNELSFYGPWETIVTVEDEASASEDSDASAPTSAALNTQARRALSGKYPVPIILAVGDDGSLTLSDSLTINDLVAGINVPVLAQRNVTPVAQMQRLSQLTVTETSMGETIKGNFESAGDIEAVPEPEIN